MWKKFNFKLKYTGINFSNFLNFLIKNNIKIFNVDKSNSKEILFEMSNKEYKKFKKINSIYSVEVKNYGGFKNFIKKFLCRSGLLGGAILIAVSSIFWNNRIVSIKVVNGQYEDKIIETMKNYGVEIGGINNFDNEKLEKYLLENLDEISLVSVKKQGNVIIVNAVEKQEKYENFEPYYAPYNMVIKDIKVISGTPNVKKDDVVKKGKVLVGSYTISSTGERISVPAKAEIVADVWFCGSETAKKEIVVTVKTGNKKVYNSIDFFKIKNHAYLSQYYNYVTETTCFNITNNCLLPIYLTKTTIYEVQEKVLSFDFENEKNNYLEKSKQKAYTILPKNVTIQEITQNISELSDRYVFQTYLKTTMELNNEN